MQVAIPFADRSKFFSVNVLRNTPLGLKPSALRDTGTLCPDSDSSVVQAAGHFSSSAVKFLLGGEPFQTLRPSGLHALEIGSSLGGYLNDALPHNLFRLAY
jgi:hypothetical protein